MSDFWAGYLLGGGSNGDSSIPPGVALLFAAFLGFVALLYVFQGIFNAVADVTQSQPILSLVLVGALSAGIGELIGTNTELDVSEKITATGALVLVLFGVFWVIGELSGASSMDSTSLPVKITLTLLSLVIVGGFAYMVLSLIRYRCGTSRGRIIRSASIVLLAWWAWISVFSLPLPPIPLLEANTFLVLGTLTTLATGVVES